MKKLLLLAAVPALVLLAASCSKEGFTSTITVKQLTSIKTDNNEAYAFSYSDNGIVTEITRSFFNGQDTSKSKWKLSYNSKGDITGIAKSFNGELTSTCTITYTENARTAVIDQNGPVGKIEQQLNADGNPISETSYYYENNTWVEEAKSTLKWVDGNLVETVFGGSYTTTYQYDNMVNPLYPYYKGFVSVSNLFDNDFGLIPSKNNATQTGFMEFTFTYNSENYPVAADVTINSGWFQSREKRTYSYQTKIFTVNL